MKNLSIKNISLLSISLMGVSAFITAMIPSKKVKAVNDRIPNNGIAVFSTFFGSPDLISPATVVFTVVGSRSYTQTYDFIFNPAGSATSLDDLNTNTSIRSWSTFDATTPVEWEDIDVVHCDII